MSDLIDKMELAPIIRIACPCGHDWYTRQERIVYALKLLAPRWMRRTILKRWYHQREDLEHYRRKAEEMRLLFEE